MAMLYSCPKCHTEANANRSVDVMFQESYAMSDGCQRRDGAGLPQLGRLISYQKMWLSL